MVSAVTVVACRGEDEDPPDPGAAAQGGAPPGVQETHTDLEIDPDVATALPPASEIPPGLNTATLPPDTEVVEFNFTRVSLIAPGRSAVTLDMLVADTFERRTRGLMFRESLPANTGMLFAFPAPTTSPFWAKDTWFDLDIAFLDEAGQVLEILALEAESTELIQPEAEYLYAVELPQGWFAERGYGLESRFLVPPSVEGFAE